MARDVLFIENTVDGYLSDATSVVLQDQTGTYGIRRISDGVIVVPAGTPMQHVSPGRYEFNISSFPAAERFEFVIRVDSITDGVQYHYGIIDIDRSALTVTDVIGQDFDGILERNRAAAGTATFAHDGTADISGMRTPEGYGFDGTQDLPATGGARTNRDKKGDGYWDGIPYEALCVCPIGPRGQCFKAKALAMTRVQLRDLTSSCRAISDDEIDMLLESSLSYFNSVPMFTAFTWDMMEDRWLYLIAVGAQAMALMAMGLTESAREFNITDNGIQFTPPPLSTQMQAQYSLLMQTWRDSVKETKNNMRPATRALGTFRTMQVSSAFIRLRHLREKAIF